MNMILLNILKPLFTRLGTFIGSAVITLGATSEQSAELQTYLVGAALIIVDLFIRQIVKGSEE